MNDNEGKESYEGSSEAGFSAAVAEAVRRAEEDGRLRPTEEGTVTLTVVSWEVDVHGPLGEYRVVLQRP
jgi:flavin-binding protein dodecin